MTTDENVRSWFDAGSYSVKHITRKILVMLVDDPEGAQNELLDCLERNEKAMQRWTENNRLQNEAVELEDAKFT